MSGYLNVQEYIEWVANTLGYHLAVKDFTGFLVKEIGNTEASRPYYIHNNPYCMFVKSNSRLWTHCQEASKRLRNRCMQSDAPFTGMCYCGFSELIVPIKAGDRVIGAVCAGGFELSPSKSKRRMEKISFDNGLDPCETQRRYDLAVGPASADPAEMIAVCSIVAQYFSLYYSLLVEKGLLRPDSLRMGDTTRLYILSHAEEYIRQNYAADIRVTDIARFCRCSESYISHIFKKRTGVNISRYISEVRIVNAKEAIASTGDSFLQIAGRCGFSDPAYFSVVFKNITGKTPSQYRAEFRHQ